MKKTAIITELYKTTNYGGALQAYALCEAINKLGYSAQQILYFEGLYDDTQNSNKSLSIKSLLVKAVNSYIEMRFSKRYNEFENFINNIIPCADKVYDDDSLKELLDKYDVFITGSDQVWNPLFFRNGYLLSFVDDGHIKFSYAASLGCSELNDEQKKVFKENLKDYNAISVREKEAAELLQPLTDVPVETTVDPVFLLSKDDWDKIESKRIINEKYIFAYLLGSSESQRRLIESFAVKKNLKIVFIPYVLDFYRKCDTGFGDIRLYDVSPQDFISLIKNAEYVFTDSFHASAFSIIYNKQFFALSRNSFGNSGSRLYNLTRVFDCDERFCDSEEKATLGYIEKLPPLLYSETYIEFETLKKQSIDYLVRNIS